MRLIKKPQQNTVSLYNEDCLVIMKQLADESVDCVITDCPYHIVSGGCAKDPTKYRECKGMLNKRSLLSENKHISLSGILNDSDPSNYTKNGKLFKHNDIKFQDWLPDVYRVLKEGTHCYIMINGRNLMELQQEAEKVGFVFQNLLVWDKGNATPNKYYLNSIEHLLMLRKGKAKNINKVGTKNILRIPNIIGNKKHPTEKPVDLMTVFVENSTNAGDTVLDPFMGVGATGVACKRLQRRFIGCEIDEKYFNIAKDRVSKVE